MKIRLRYVKGEGFLTFYDLFELRIADYEGQSVQIDGWNKDDPLSKSNGSGKSSLLEAISWNWYGELGRRNRYKDEVIYNRNGIKAPLAWVESEFELEGNVYRVRRVISWKKSQDVYIWINEEEILKEATYAVRQQRLETILGMNFTAFLCSEMFGRDFMNFPDLKPSERGKILTDIWSLDKYVDASRICSEETKKLQSSINSLEKQLHLIEGRIAQLRELNYKQQIDNFEADRDKRLKSLDEEVEDCKLNLGELEKNRKLEISKVEADLRRYEQSLDTIEKQLSNLSIAKNKYLDLEKRKAQLQTIQSTIDQQIHNTHKELDQLKRLSSGGTCPVCKQPISDAHLDQEIARWEDKILDNERKLRAVNSEIQTVEGSLVAIRDNLKHLEHLQVSKDDYLSSIHQAQLKILSLEQSPEEEKIRSRIENIKREQETIRKMPNPYKEQESTRKATLFSLASEAKSLRQQIESLETESKYYAFWAEGFKKIRFSLFGTAIDRFQDYAQATLSQYTSELQIYFSTERETRSGTVKDEFDISVTDASGTTLSYELYSGGEKQKLRLSIALALAQMIRDSCGKEFNFIAFDEPNDALDDCGKSVNFEVFSKLAQDGRAVLVTDHDALFKDQFDRTIVVVKENGKSRIEHREGGR